MEGQDATTGDVGGRPQIFISVQNVMAPNARDSAELPRIMLHEPMRVLADISNYETGGVHSDSTLAGDKWLAKISPNNALRNADNYARFIMGQMGALGN
jgi:hypothetical protein